MFFHDTWEMWVGAWAFLATIAVVLGLGWLLVIWWRWVKGEFDQDKST